MFLRKGSGKGAPRFLFLWVSSRRVKTEPKSPGEATGLCLCFQGGRGLSSHQGPAGLLLASCVPCHCGF